MSGTAVTVVEVFERQAARRPEAIAVCDAGGRLTYAELDRRTNRLAHEPRVRWLIAPDAVWGTRREGGRCR